MLEPSRRRGASGRPARTPGTRIGRGFALAWTVAAVSVGLASPASATTVSVNCTTGGDLQAKLDSVASGSTILVHGVCLGNFIVDGKSVTIKGNPTATLDGNDLGRTLEIDNTVGKTIHLVGLTITGGVAPSGAGISKQAGRLTLSRTTVAGNLVEGDFGQPSGGGISSSKGNVTLTNSKVRGNRVLATGTATFALGGGLSLLNGNLTAIRSTISGNRTTAHPTAPQFSAIGGGVYLDGGSLVLQASTMSGNRVVASAAGDMFAYGTAAYAGSIGHTKISGSLITGNVATATSSAASSQAGQTLYLLNEPVSIARTRITDNSATATSPGGADAEAGGVYSQLGLTLSDSTVDGNEISATSTGDKALAEGGGIETSQTTKVVRSTLSRNRVSARTSASGFQANAWGGGGYVGDLTASNSTIALNAVSASSGPGGHAYVDGAGLDASGCCSIVSSTIAGNSLSITGPSAGVYGGGLYTTSGMSIEGTILANNTSVTGPDCYGSSSGPTSKGHNLIRKATGCNFTKAGTDKVGVDPKLGPLSSNGGPTQTMAIALGSPARDAIPTPYPVKRDQRGVQRPQGPGCDIGAYERKAA